jgi:hypothetical protein
MPDACAQTIPLIPGEVVGPELVVDGLAACRAQVVPEHRMLELLYDERIAVYWRERAERCGFYRELDRERAEQVCGQRWEYGMDVRAELRVARAALVGVGVASFLAGVGLAYVGRRVVVEVANNGAD